MPNVDMPILEAPPLTGESTLNQQDEDFLRELTSYNSYPSNEAIKPQENFETFSGENYVILLSRTFILIKSTSWDGLSNSV